MANFYERLNLTRMTRQAVRRARPALLRGTPTKAKRFDRLRGNVVKISAGAMASPSRLTRKARTGDSGGISIYQATTSD